MGAVGLPAAGLGGVCPGVSVVSRWFFGGVSVVSRWWLGGAVSFVEWLCLQHE